MFLLVIFVFILLFGLSDHITHRGPVCQEGDKTNVAPQSQTAGIAQDANACDCCCNHLPFSISIERRASPKLRSFPLREKRLRRGQKEEHRQRKAWVGLGPMGREPGMSTRAELNKQVPIPQDTSRTYWASLFAYSLIKLSMATDCFNILSFQSGYIR
jgi:hypothetical protein